MVVDENDFLRKNDLLNDPKSLPVRVRAQI
jgi:hypothetical protein